jgi:hypothetical protein
MHKIVHIGVPPQAHLVAEQSLSADDFDRVVRELRDYACEPFQARKIGYVMARQATGFEAVETRFNGEAWTSEASPGDWIVTNMGNDRQVLLDGEGHANTYVVRKDRFSGIYERDTGDSPFGEVYRAKGVVDAVFLAGGFDMRAPWGDRQLASTGYLLRNGAEAYGIDKVMFDTTYRRMHDAHHPG